MNTVLDAQLSGRQRHTILLIGDNVGPLKPIAFALQHRSHTVLWAQYGREALRSVRLESPGLVVCEIDLPDLSGVEVCQMIKSAFLTRTPVVLVGSPAKVGEETHRAIKAGADDTIADLSDTRYVLARLEWLAKSFPPSRQTSPEVSARICT